MDDDIRALASARREVESLKEGLTRAEHALAISGPAIRVAQLKKRVADMEKIRAGLRKTICQDAIETYEATGNRRPHSEVVVEVRRRPVSFYQGEIVRHGSFVVHISSDLDAYITEEESGDDLTSQESVV